MLLFADGFDTYTNWTQGTQARWLTDNNSNRYPHGPGQGYQGRGTPPGGAMFFDFYSAALWKPLPQFYGTLVAGVAIYITDNIPQNYLNVINFLDGSIGYISQVLLRMNSTGALAVYANNGATLLATSSGTPLAAGHVWHYLEFKATIHNTAGAYAVRLDGATVPGIPDASSVNTRYSGSTNNGANAFGIGYGGPGTNAYWLADDAYLCDTSGGVNNDFLGDTRVIGLRPNGPGTYSQWTPVGASQNWAAITDRSTPSAPNISPDGDTTYVLANSVGTKDSYSYEDLPVGISGVRAVVMAPFMRREDGASRTVTPLVRAGGTEASGPAIVAPLSPTQYFSPESIMETNPNTGAAWTLSDVNGSEFGLTLAS